MKPSAAHDAGANRRLAFFLGGHDLEMDTIRELVRQTAPEALVVDRGLAWGATWRAYEQELVQAELDGLSPVLIELDVLPPVARPAWIVVDHHGRDSGTRPSSLRQVFDLLRHPESRWTRELALVDANDRGGIDGLVAAGASRDETLRIRAADRAAQGTTNAEEADAARAVSGATRPHPRLTIVSLPHDRSATVTDRLHAASGGPGYDILVLFGRHETNVFGDGPLLEHLHTVFPGGWLGGNLPLRGFWGVPRVEPRVESTTVDWLAAGNGRGGAP